MNWKPKIDNKIMFWGYAFLLSLLFVFVSCSGNKQSSVLEVSPTALQFDETQTSTSIYLINSEPSTIKWSGLDGKSWLSLSREWIAPGKNEIHITVNRNGLVAGKYSGNIKITSNHRFITIPVIMHTSGLQRELTIVSPENELHTTSFQSLNFSASARNTNGVAISDSALTWVSDIDGPIGTGTSFVTQLSPGIHTISLNLLADNESRVVDAINVYVDDPVGGRIYVNQKGVEALHDVTAPRNITRHGFIENSAEEIGVKSVTLSISALDNVGVSDYFILESKDKEIGVAKPGKNERGWVGVITPSPYYIGVITYNFRQDYDDGDEVHLFVWFKDGAGNVSDYVHGSVIYYDSRLLVEEGNNSTDIESGLISGALFQDSKTTDFGSLGISNSEANVSNTEPFSSSSTDNSDENAEKDKDAENSNESVIYYENFEQGDGGWRTDNGIWEIGAQTSNVDITCNNSMNCFGTGYYPDFTDARLISPVIQLPVVKNNQKLQLSFMQWYEFHEHDVGNLQIYVEQSPEKADQWTTLSALSGNTNTWQNDLVDLTNYAGQKVQLGFDLNQDMNVGGVGMGWFVDDIKIVATQ